MPATQTQVQAQPRIWETATTEAAIGDYIRLPYREVADKEVMSDGRTRLVVKPVSASVTEEWILPAPVASTPIATQPAQTIDEQVEVDSRENTLMGNPIYRVWVGSKLIGKFYQTSNGHWFIDPAGTRDNRPFGSAALAQAAIVNTHKHNLASTKRLGEYAIGKYL